MFRTYRSFPRVPAIVLSTNVKETNSGEGSNYWPQIEFQYSVNGVDYISTRLWSVGSLPYFSCRRAEKLLEKLHTDPNFHVFCDPDNPEFAFVRNGHWATFLLPLLAGAGFLVAAFYILTSSDHALERLRN